mgnify:FL=1
MTKIYIYCLFDRMDTFLGVYSSLQAVHRDALRYCNHGSTGVYMRRPDGLVPPSLKELRNIFKGSCDVEVQYQSNKHMVKIYKTKLKE